MKQIDLRHAEKIRCEIRDGAGNGAGRGNLTVRLYGPPDCDVVLAMRRDAAHALASEFVYEFSLVPETPAEKECEMGDMIRRSDEPQPMSFAEVQRIGEVFAKSGMFADCREATQAIVKIMAGRELGIPPFQAMNGVHIVKGKASIGAGLIAARIKSSAKYNFVVRRLDAEVCEIDFFEGGKLIGDSVFTMADAKKAGTQNLEKYPRNMLFARAITNGARWHCPDVFGGPIYTPEELRDGESDAIEVRTAVIERAEPLTSTEPPKFVWGEPRGENFITANAMDRLRLNLEALGVADEKMAAAVMAKAGALYPDNDWGTVVANLPAKAAGAIIGATDAALKAKGVARPEREFDGDNDPFVIERPITREMVFGPPTAPKKTRDRAEKLLAMLEANAPDKPEFYSAFRRQLVNLFGIDNLCSLSSAQLGKLEKMAADAVGEESAA